jgi:murein L,D-transpeptidase YafK
MGLAILMSSSAAAESAKANRILVDKSERTLVLFSEGRPLRSYPVALGGNPRGHKRYEGDRRTPEGIYLIDGKNPNSAYHLSLHISYPNERDVRVARERDWDPGGQIMIHGMPTGLIKTSNKYDSDWTDGCIAVSNAAIEEIWKLVDEGTLIEITP